MKWTTMAGCVFAFSTLCFAQTTHYLDCGVTSTTGDSLRSESAWNSLDQANAFVFQPGDRLLLRRGSRCDGMLEPKGSGTAQASIIIGSYGEGPLPVIAGGKHRAGIQLMNQQYWEIENLEIMGGSPYGLHISTNRSSIRHFRLHNLVIHYVTGEPTTKESGLLVVAPAPNTSATINDVLVDGVTAYDTTEWAGIIIAGASYNEHEQQYGQQITIKNSIVHDVAGDGILLASAKHGVIEHNVAWNTGMQETETIGTPNAIWEWMCIDCHIAWNEGFFSDSPGVDGGVFDIDYGNVNNTVEHNFAHDSQGYCVSVFGAEGQAGDSINSIVRENTCLHNGRSPRMARRQGAIFVHTWHNGHLNGMLIERNTLLWEPPLDAPAIHANGEFTGNLPNRITGNRILLLGGSSIQANPPIQVGANFVCAPRQEGVMQTSTTAQPMQDFCSCWIEWRKQFANGANGAQAITAPAAQIAGFGRGWRLAATFAPSDSTGESRSRAVLLESMVHQFGSQGLRGVLWPRNSLSKAEAELLRGDWHLSSQIDITLAGLQNSNTGLLAQPGVFLLAPDGSTAAGWQTPIEIASVWLELEHRLGTPLGMQPTPFCGDK